MDHDQMVRVYMKMKAKKAELKKACEAEVATIDAGMAQIEGLLLKSLLGNKVKSMATGAGTFYIEQVVYPQCKDWQAYRQWMIENDALDGVEKRVTKSFIVDYMRDNEDNTPPGINVQREQVVRIRTASK